MSAMCKPNLNFKVQLEPESENKLGAGSGVHLMRTPYEKSALNAHDIQAKVAFLNTSFDGKDIPSVSYSNLLPNEKLSFSGGYVDVAVQKLLEDPTIINHGCKSINIYADDGERFQTVITKFLGADTFEKYREDFRESDVQTPEQQTDQRGKFRVISLYWVGTEDNSSTLFIVVLDPYHLVFPTGDNWERLYTSHSARSLRNGQTFEDAYHQEFEKIERFNVGSL